MSDLAEFLLARVAEDEAKARDYWGEPHRRECAENEEDRSLDCDCRFPARVLAECEAKRRIVQRHRKCGTGIGYCDDGGHGWGDGLPLGCAELADLALPYADHPDYREEWKP